MKTNRKISIEYSIVAVFSLLVIASYIFNWQTGKQMADACWDFGLKMLFILPCIFLIIGLLDVWIPKAWIQRRIGEKSGIKGALYVIFLAMLQGGPLYGAFPVAHLLRKKGCSLRNVFIYLGAFSTLKIPMMMFEASFLGWSFTFVRGILALPVFLIIAEIMTRYARLRGTDMRNTVN